MVVEEVEMVVVLLLRTSLKVFDDTSMELCCKKPRKITIKSQGVPSV